MTYKKVGLFFGAAAIALVIAACKPSFSSGSTLTTSAIGPLVKITWPTINVDSDKTVTNYRIDVDGTQIALVSPSWNSCVVTGLAASTSYDITVSAYDSANQWSGPDAGGELTATYATPSTGNAGTTKSCVSAADTDGDRLPDGVENNTGHYVSAAQTGTNPLVVDTDNDGMKDGDEVLGTTGGLNLPAMGASPTKKDIAFEFDWFDDNAEPGVCAAHSHRPTAGVISKVATAYGTAPVSNPDGTTGIHLIADYGQGGAFTGGNLVADADGVIAGGVNGADYTAIKTANFNTNRQGIFHYVLMPHRYGTNSTSSGQAEISGNDMVVSLYCYGSDQNVANTIVHEAGHNLGLRHGGDEDTNYKPNYNSVMNYLYQFPGIDTNCALGGDGVLSYSVGTRATLNESSLLETNGICNGVDIDWNGNSIIDAGAVSADINQDGLANGVLHDYNDWANIQLSAVNNPGAPVGQTSPQLVTEQPVPWYAENK
jgi:hypothetical protein